MMRRWNYGTVNPGFWPNDAMGFANFFIHILFWVLVFWAVIALIKHLTRSSYEDEPKEIGSADKSLEIIRERYAKGDISKKEYDQLKKDLEII